MLDRYSNSMCTVPVRDKSAPLAYEALRKFRGSSYLHRVHTDGSNELKQVVAWFGFNHTTSTPGRPQRNGVIENRVWFVKRHGSACAKQAGLPARAWTWSIPYFCDAMNFTVDEDGDSPYNKRFNQGHYNGHKIPFGVKVDFMMPLPTLRKPTKRMTMHQIPKSESL